MPLGGRSLSVGVVSPALDCAVCPNCTRVFDAGGNLCEGSCGSVALFNGVVPPTLDGFISFHRAGVVASGGYLGEFAIWGFGLTQVVASPADDGVGADTAAVEVSGTDLGKNSLGRS